MIKLDSKLCAFTYCVHFFNPSISPFRILLAQCVFPSFLPKTTTWGSLSTSVQKTDAILMLWILKNAQFGNKACPAPAVCWRILSQGHFSSVIPNWQWACMENCTMFFSRHFHWLHWVSRMWGITAVESIVSLECVFWKMHKFKYRCILH